MRKVDRILVYLRNKAAYLEEGCIDDPGFYRALAMARRTGATIDVVDVLIPGEDGRRPRPASRVRGDSLFLRCRGLGKDILADTVRPYQREFDITVDVLEGNPVVAITERAIRGRYDMVIKTARPGPNGNAPYGELARKLIRYCPCPVLIARQGTGAPAMQILAAVGPTRDSESQALNEQVLEAATALADLQDMEVHVLHAWQADDPLGKREDPTSIAERRNAAADLWQVLGKRAPHVHPSRVHLVEGEPHEAVSRYCRAHPVDSVVVGTFGRTGLDRAFLGNTAERLFDRPTADVVAIKPRSFASPAGLGFDPTRTDTFAL